MPESNLPGLLAADLDLNFLDLVNCYQGRLYAFAFRMVGNSQDAEEIVQDAFVRAYRALQSYPPSRIEALFLKPWLYRITLNLTRNRLRNKRFQLVPLEEKEEDAGWQFMDAVENGPEMIFSTRETRQELAEAILFLPEKFRAAVSLRFIVGLNYSEMAGVLDQPPGTIKANVHRGLKRLRENLSKQKEEVTL